MLAIDLTRSWCTRCVRYDGRNELGEIGIKFGQQSALADAGGSTHYEGPRGTVGGPRGCGNRCRATHEVEENTVGTIGRSSRQDWVMFVLSTKFPPPSCF